MGMPVSVVSCLLVASAFTDTLRSEQLGELDLTVLDAETKQPIPARLRILDSRGRAPRIRNVPRLGNDFTFRDLLSFKLRTGKYRFTIDRGPHYHQRNGILEVDRDGFDQKTLLLPRFVDIREEGWFGGDLLVRRQRDEMEILLAAEELDIACVPSWDPGKALTRPQLRYARTTEKVGASLVDFSCGVAVTDGGRLLAANVSDLVDPAAVALDAHGFATAMKHKGAHLSLLDPYGYDLPMLVAHGLADSVAILSDDLRLDADATAHSGRKTKDPRFRGQHGLGRFAEHIYFQLLESGHKIAPAAVSGSGDTDNPPGYNRVYVACGQEFSSEAWWNNLRLGRAIVSNGPVLRVRANDQLPGYVFTATTGAKVEIDLSCKLGTRQKVEYLEVIKNGRVVESVRLGEWAKTGGRLPIIEFTESGWLAVRAAAPGEMNYRCALSAPFFVEIGGATRVSKQAAEFFLDWVYDRARAIRRLAIAEEEMRARIAQQRVARDYWAARVDRATAP